MPELPEVETTARSLQRSLPGSKVIGVRELDYAPTVEPLSPKDFIKAMVGRQITSVGRRAKYILLPLDNDHTLTVHLRMSGRLFTTPAETPADRHTRLILDLDNYYALHFRDVRKFGRMQLLTAAEYAALDSRLGPEPLGTGFNSAVLAERLQAHPRARLKPLLLDQQFLAGLGNIYADESLFRAGLHPLRQAGTLSMEEIQRLRLAICEVLSEAIIAEGTTLSNGVYRFGQDQPGRFAERLQVYGHEGKTCPQCGEPLQRQIIGGRSSHFCPACQV